LKNFDLSDYINSSHLYSQVASLQPQFLKRGNAAIAHDALAIIDRANPTQILVLDTTSGMCLPLLAISFDFMLLPVP
jgi:hypothetical protein